MASNKAKIAGYFNTYLNNEFKEGKIPSQIVVADKDLISQNKKLTPPWRRFFMELSGELPEIVEKLPDEKLSDFTITEKETLRENNKKNYKKLYDLAIKYKLFKNGDPTKAQPVSQEVKDSAIPPFMDDPDAPSSSGPPPMQEQQGEMSLTPLSELPLEVYNSIVYSQDQKQQAGGLLSSMFKDKNIISKMKKAVKTGNKKTREKSVQQEQELKEARQKIVALANAERIAQTKQDMLERDAKARLDQQESFYKARLKAEKESNQAKLDPKEVARQLEEYKTRFETESKAQAQKAQEEQRTSNERFERLKKLAKEKEDKYQLTLKEKEDEYQLTLKELELKSELGDRKEAENKAKRLKAIEEQKQSIKTLFDLSATQAVENLEKTTESKLNRNEQKLNQLKISLEKLSNAKNLDMKKIQSLKFQIEDLNEYERNRQNLEYNVWDVLDFESAAESAIAEQKMGELKQEKIKEKLKKEQFEKNRLASELKQTVEVKEREEKIEPITSYLDNVAPFLTAPLLVLAGNLLAGSNKNADSAMATVLSSGTLALMTYLRSIYRPEEVKQAIEDARTLPIDKRVTKILKQAKAVPKPEPEPDPDPGPSGPAGGSADVPDEKGIDTRLLIAGGAAVGIGGGMLARRGYDALPNFRQFFNGDFTLPGYNFLGPGTDIKERIASGLKPVDLLDKIAYEHDLLYSLARNPAQIREADQNMKNAIDKYLKDDIFANMIKEIITQKMDYEQKSLFEFSNKILEENKQTSKQQRNIYDQLLNEISYNQPASAPALEPPETVQDIKTTEPDITIETMPPKNEQVSGLEEKEEIKEEKEAETKAETKTEVKGTTRPAVKTRPVVYNPPPPIGPDRSRVSGGGGPGRPFKTTVDGKQVAPLRGAGFPDRAVTDQGDYINEDEIKRGPGILKPKFIMPSVNILNRTEQEQYVDDLEFAMFDFVQDDSGGNDPDGTNPLLRDQNLSLGLRYQRAGVTINSLFGENLPDNPRNMSQQRIKELFLGESLIPEMKFLYSDQFEAQEFNLSEFEVDQYDVNNDRTAIEMLSPYADFTDNQLLDQYIDTSILYGIVP